MNKIIKNTIKVITIGGISLGMFELGGIFGQGKALGLLKKYNLDVETMLNILSKYDGKGKWKIKLIESFSDFISKEES